MQINWENTINQIFGDILTCPRCAQDEEQLIIGYSRKPSLNKYAPRHRNCPRGEECDARKLITLCEACARLEGLPGSPVGAAEAIETYMLDCRRDLEESLDYIAEYWRDDYELGADDLDAPLEEIDPDVFGEETTWRHRLEEEYLRYHREFRDRKRRIPAAGWRSEYVEEIRTLGYDTLLGDSPSPPMPQRPRSSLRSGLVTGTLFAVLFGGGLAAGYVYWHEPARDTLEVVVASTSATGGTRTVSGTVASIEGTRLTLTTAGGPVTVTLASGAPTDDLVRATGGLPNGARVNVGVQSTQYGLVLTGLVAVEGAP